MPNESKSAAASVLALCALAAGLAHAEPSAADRALAQSLFDQGRALMEAGNLDDACPKLAESQRLDPGGGTLLNLGICYEKAGKVASAWAVFEEAVIVARKDGRPEREKFCKDHIDALKPRLSTLTIRVPASSQTDGLNVKLDGTALGAASIAVPMNVDPGEHNVTATAPGRQPWAGTIRVNDHADRREIEVPVLAELASAAAAAPTPKTAPMPAPAPAQAAAPDVSRRQVAREPAPSTGSSSALPYVAAGLGMAALGVGTYFGLRAKSSWDSRNTHCTAGVCDADAVRYGDDTKKFATVANVGIGLGLVGLGVGTYLLLTPSDGSRDASGARPVPQGGLRAAIQLGPGTIGAAGQW